MRCRLSITGICCILLWASFGTAAQGAEDPLRKGITEIAVNIAGLLKGIGEDSVSIGQFTGPPTMPTNAGPGVVQMFEEALRKEKIVVKPVAKVGLKGEYALIEIDDPNNRADKALALEIRGSLVNSFGKVLTEFSANRVVAGKFDHTVMDEKAIIAMTGLTVDLPPAEAINPASRKERIEQSYTAPTAHLRQDCQVRASASSPYAVEILVNDVPCSVQLASGLPTMQLNEGDVYAIRLINESPHDAAVFLLIDGISTFNFTGERDAKTGGPRYSFYVVPARSKAVIRGWHRSSSQVDSFKVAAYEQSAAGRLGHKSDLGVICASFAAAWPTGAAPPADEPPQHRSGPLATGFGPPVEQNTREVGRQTGVVRAAVTLRYTKN